MKNNNTDKNGGNPSAAKKKEETRRRLMNAARKIFSRDGYEFANVSDIVGELGMAQGTFYYHFEDKKSVLLEMLGEFFGRVREVIAGWAESTDAGAEAAAGFGRALANIFYENRELAKIIKREAYNPDPGIRGLIEEFYSYLYSRTKLGLELGIGLGLVRPMDTDVAAPALVGMIERVVEEQVKRRKKPDFEHIINEIMELQNFGIRPKDKDEV